MHFNDFVNENRPDLVERLNERHKRIIAANRSDIEGKKVLDLACHNGRWSCAAAEAGAREVVGVEGRPELAKQAVEIAKELGLADRVRFEAGDMYRWLYAHSGEQFDTVFCLGVYYHIMDHYQLLRLIAGLKPNCIIIDSGFVRSFRPLVHVRTENPNLISSALPAFAGQEQEIIGIVSLGLMNQMALNCGYVVEPITWDPKEVKNKKCVEDYMSGIRYTLRLRRKDNLHGQAGGTDDRWRDMLKRLNPNFVKLLDPSTAYAAEDPRAQAVAMMPAKKPKAASPLGGILKRLQNS